MVTERDRNWVGTSCDQMKPRANVGEKTLLLQHPKDVAATSLNIGVKKKCFKYLKFHY